MELITATIKTENDLMPKSYFAANITKKVGKISFKWVSKGPLSETIQKYVDQCNKSSVTHPNVVENPVSLAIVG